jgi:multicomponent K+:H+ antiporter subunit D
MLFGMIGVLSSQELPRLTGFGVLLSSGTIMAMLGYGNPAVTAGAMYYLIASTLALSSLFLLAELMERGRSAEAGIIAITLEAFGDDEVIEHEDEIGITIPATMAVLGVSFACCALLIAGMPPLSGFIGKFAMLAGVLGVGGAGNGAVPPLSWALMALLVVSGLGTMIAMLRTGINRFWATADSEVPRVRVVEMTPIALLLGLSLTLTILAGPAMAYLEAMSYSLYTPNLYVEAVLGAPEPPALPPAPAPEEALP